MDQIKQAQTLLAYAVRQYGQDRIYEVSFLGKGPVVSVSEFDYMEDEENLIAQVSYAVGKIKTFRFY